MTNRKSHTRFRFVPKSTALDDLERPLRTLFKMHAFSEPITKIWMKIDLHYHRRNAKILRNDNDNEISGNTRFMRIFAGVPWRWGIQ